MATDGFVLRTVDPRFASRLPFGPVISVNDVERTQLHPARQQFWSRTPSERTVVLLVIDVEIDNVRRNFSLAELAGDLVHPCFGIVTVAALLVAEGGQGRKRRAANQ